jgi:hypothetical protein
VTQIEIGEEPAPWKMVALAKSQGSFEAKDFSGKSLNAARLAVEQGTPAQSEIKVGDSTPEVN